MRRREQLAALLAILIAAPLVFMMARALADGFVRHREAPLRSMLGPDVYEKLQSDQQPEKHYLGNDYRAPDFSLPDRHGRPWKLSDHEGKVVVMNFWSVTCRPCIQEMPSLEKLAEMAERWDDVEVVSVSTDNGWNEVRTIMADNPKLTVLFDPEKRIVEEAFGTKLYPETWIIDKKGVVRLRYDGPFEWSSPLATDVIRSFR